MLKEFLDKYPWMAVYIERRGKDTFRVCLYNKTYSAGDPVFEHIISPFSIEHLAVDFETIVMTPILSWIEELEAKQKKGGAVNDDA